MPMLDVGKFVYFLAEQSVAFRSLLASCFAKCSRGYLRHTVITRVAGKLSGIVRHDAKDRGLSRSSAN